MVTTPTRAMTERMAEADQPGGHPEGGENKGEFTDLVHGDAGEKSGPFPVFHPGNDGFFGGLFGEFLSGPLAYFAANHPPDHAL